MKITIPLYRCSACSNHQDAVGKCFLCGDPVGRILENASVEIRDETTVDSLEVETGEYDEVTEEVETGRYAMIAGVKHPVKETRTTRKPRMRKLTNEEKAAKKQEIRGAIAYWKAREDK